MRTTTREKQRDRKEPQDDHEDDDCLVVAYPPSSIGWNRAFAQAQANQRMKNSRIKDFFQKKRGPKRKRFKIPEESNSDSEEEVTNETTTETKAGKYGTVTTVRTVIKSKRKRGRGGVGKHHQGFRSRIAPIIMKARQLKQGTWIIINDATDESDTDESENGPIGWNKPIIVRAKKGKNGAYIIIDDTDESDQGRKRGGRS